MELDGGLPCCAPFAHTLFRAQIVQHFADGHRGARCFYAAIDFRTEATFTGLCFGFEAKDRVDYRDAVIDRDLLQSVGHRAGKIAIVLNHPVVIGKAVIRAALRP